MKVEKDRLTQLKRDAIQGFVKYIGLKAVSLSPGKFTTRLKLEKRHLQQDGFAHAGLVAAMADHTAGYASFSVVPADRRILTMEYKISYFRPADGDCLECKGHVIKAGRQVLFTQADVYAVKGKEKTLVARAMHTMTAVPVDRMPRA
jgi:uncharacterized protein (TIGR00369 family)